MEPHPVPKNILTVEFKLFGSLSVRQFFKVLGVCAIGLVLFALPIPKLVTIPVIAVTILLGVLSALVPTFQVRLFGFIRALFVSPRYVWRKQQLPPEILQKQQQEKVESNAIEKVAKSNATPSLSRLNIDQLIDAKNLAKAQDDNLEDVLDIASGATSGFDRYYSQEFANSKPARAASNTSGASQALDPINSQAGQTASVTNNLDSAVTNLANKQDVAANFDTAKAALSESLPLNTDRPHKYIYGIVVDKSENPVPAATVIILDDKGKQVEPQTLSGSDGRFNLDVTGLGFGSYVMRILHPRFAFYDFRVNYDDKKLPAYKFKARQ